MMDFVKDIGLPLVAALIAVVWNFLRKADEQQDKNLETTRDHLQKQCSILFIKHDEDAARLSELKESIARNHYERSVLDGKFQRLEDSMKNGFHEIGTKIDKLSDALMAHITKDNK